MNTHVLAEAKPTRATSASPVRSNFLQRKCACGGTPGPMGECETCRKKQGAEMLHRESNELLPPIVSEVIGSSGQALDAGTRAFMEPLFHHDFTRVRVHTDPKAADSVRAVHAHAYTVGNNIVFGRSKFAPTTHSGRELLAHELAHTIQQRGPSGAAQCVLTASTLEASAELAGRAASSGRMVEEPLGRSPLVVARQPAAEEEDEEEKIVVSMALPTGRTAAPSPPPSPRKPPRRGALGKFEPGGFPVVLGEGGRILTEHEAALEVSSREEEKRTEEKKQKELEESHDRLQMLRGRLDRSGYIDTKDDIMTMITGKSLLDGQILRHYGVELPPSRSTKRKAFTDDVVDAIDKFDSEWRHGAAAASPMDIKGLRERQTQQENEAARFETYSYTTESVLAGVGASVTSVFTDDPKKIAAGAAIGAAISGTVGSVATGKAIQIEQAAIRESSRTGQNPSAAVPPKAKSEPPPTRKETIAEIEQAEQRYNRLREKAAQAERDYAKSLRNTVRAKEQRADVPTEQEKNLLETKRALEKARDDALAKLKQLRQEQAGQAQPAAQSPGQQGLAQEPKYLEELRARGLSARLTDKSTPVIDAAILGTPEVHSVKSVVSGAGTEAAVRSANSGSPRDLADRVSAKITEALIDRRSDKWTRLRNQWNTTKRSTYADQFGYELPKNPDDINFVVDVRILGADAPLPAAQQAVEAAVTTWLKKNERVPLHFSWRIVYVGK